jgi:hypothetical protein
MSVAVPSAGPLWTRRDAVLLAMLLAGGAVLVALSWFFAAGRADAGDQLVFVALALLGALIGLGGVGLWTVHGRRLLGARRGLLLGTPPPAPAGQLAWAAHAAELVAGPQGKWFHRADCLLADGRGWAASPRAKHESAGRKACPGCRP